MIKFIKQFLCTHQLHIESSTLLSKVRKPDIYNNSDFVYTENKRMCNNCGSIWYDNGLELKVPVEVWLKSEEK